MALEFRPRVSLLSGFTLASLLLTGGLSLSAQSPSNQAARVTAERAFLSGKFDDVESLTQGLASDDWAVALRARALIARGEYAKAEALLKPLVGASPTGEAALE